MTQSHDPKRAQFRLNMARFYLLFDIRFACICSSTLIGISRPEPVLFIMIHVFKAVAIVRACLSSSVISPIHYNPGLVQYFNTIDRFDNFQVCQYTIFGSVLYSMT